MFLPTKNNTLNPSNIFDMIGKIILTSTFVLTTITTFAQKNIFLAREEVKRYLEAENWQGAAFAADKILTGSPTNSEFNYYGGIANLNAKNYKVGHDQIMIAASDQLEKFKDIEFWKGRAFMGIQNPDSALFYFKKYKESGGKNPVNTEGYTTDYYISQMENAIKYMATPVKATFRNMGDKINDEFDDVSPSLNTEGDLLVFTSRRNSNIGGKEDPNDGMPFEDVWISRLDTATGKWGEAENLTKMNSEGHEAVMSISPDGNTIFIYKNVGDNTGSGDIWYSRTKGDPTDWSRPREFEGEFNSSYFETSAYLAPGGKVLYYISERPDGKSLGQGDIWMCERLSRKEWKKPVNLGPLVNSKYDEISVTVHPNGKTIFFSSNSERSMGGKDIFKTEFVNGAWTEPVNLGYPINTMGDEIHFTISADGKKAFLAAVRPDGLGRYDIYEIDLSNYQLVEGQESKGMTTGSVLSVLKGKLINPVTGTTGTAETALTITVFDGETGTEVAKTESDENGNYFLTLEGGKKYKITVTGEGMKTINDEFFLNKRASGQPFTLSKSYYLEKL